MAENNLNEKEERFADLLIEAGLNKNVALCLTYISSHDNIKTKDIEFDVRLRQPEVSTAVSKLREKNWIKNYTEKKEGKGRPTHVYKLNKPLEEIINEVNERNIEKIKKLKRNINNLEKISSEF